MIKILISCVLLIFSFTSYGWTGEIEGESFVVKPWLPASIYHLDGQKKAMVTLYYQMENYSSNHAWL